MGHFLSRLELQGVVSRDALGSPDICVGSKTDVGRAQGCVSIGKRERPDRRLHLLGQERARRIISATGGRGSIGGLEAIAVNLPVDGISRRRHAGLVKGNWYRLMNSVIADIAQGQHNIILRLPLQIEADRKSTRLNSSHLGISYAVFC